ncbi:hypothetical protein LEP1GSC150_2193 [Leptospira interrogans serovar Copenhageni str. LT2050]|uniref:Uncharacterized protein n=1 Tax=Leptospira interrogans serovar Copenhageni str. LT2050 TaxID=1001598 RepID=M3G1H2_LEPIT|nr:hypothetical protein LEP1GSC150_2193 [Leptospira interrogans serovar Copenhageni str. LT2050]
MVIFPSPKRRTSLLQTIGPPPIDETKLSAFYPLDETHIG